VSTDTIAGALLAAVVLVVLAAFGPAVAPAAAQSTLTTPRTLTEPPPGRQRSANEAARIAGQVQEVRDELRRWPGARREVYQKGTVLWQVSWFANTRPGEPRREVAQVIVGDVSGAVVEAWTGYQVPWTMARGYDGAFGRDVTKWWIWVPFSLLFVLPFLDWRRPFKLLHLDLLVLSLFGVSLAFFTAANVDVSTPLVVPLLAYLLVRMLWIGLRGQRGPVRPPPLLLPVTALVVGIVLLAGFRVGLNLADSNVIDVGYSGVIGADRIADGDPLYGGWPSDNEHGDTYGPVAYLAYLPFEQVLPWGGGWDSLHAAHGAAITFDLLALVLCFFLGRRVGGTTMGVALAWAWAANPFTLFVSNTNANDALVAATVMAALLVAARPAARGALTAVAGLTKLAPLALAPLLFATERRGRLRFAAAFAVTAGVLLAATVDDLGTFYDRTLGFQAGRAAPFSIWGLWGLETLQKVATGAAVLLALAVAVVPRRRDLVGLAALSAAVLLAFQLAAAYWFYLYLSWVLPLVMLAAMAAGSGAPRARVAARPS